jgi:ribonuclease HI
MHSNSPPAHPLHKPARKCTAHVVKGHMSPLHKLMNTYRIKPGNIECIRPAPHNPALTHKRSFTISIPTDKEASKTEDAQATEKIKVYSDGLSLDGSVGAAAILIRDRKPNRMLHYHLGPSSQHTVHEAELIGILLGLHLIKMDKKGRTSYSLGVDNQAVLSTLNTVKISPSQYITDKILDVVARIRKTRNSANYSLRFRWTAGHVGIEGNEEVDAEAKKVAEGTSSVKEDLPPLLCKKIKHNKSALRQNKKSQIKVRWMQEWKTSPRYNKIKAIDKSFPSSRFIKLISDDRLSRMDTSCICQMRTGHIPLNTFLEKIGKVDSTRCPACRYPKEDTRHYLMDCPSYVHKRWALYRHCKKVTLA